MWNPYRPLGRREKWLAAAAVIGLLVIWALLSALQVIPQVKLPAPWDVTLAFLRLCWDSGTGSSALLTATVWSAGRIAVASFFVVLIGVPVGVMMGASPRLNALLSPLFDP